VGRALDREHRAALDSLAWRLQDEEGRWDVGWLKSTGEVVVRSTWTGHPSSPLAIGLPCARPSCRLPLRRECRPPTRLPISCRFPPDLPHGQLHAPPTRRDLPLQHKAPGRRELPLSVRLSRPPSLEDTARPSTRTPAPWMKDGSMSCRSPKSGARWWARCCCRRLPNPPSVLAVVVGAQLQD
jgi:hypothetical protein